MKTPEMWRKMEEREMIERILMRRALDEITRYEPPRFDNEIIYHRIMISLRWRSRINLWLRLQTYKLGRALKKRAFRDI